MFKKKHGDKARPDLAAFQREAEKVVAKWYGVHNPDVGQEYLLWQSRFDYNPERDRAAYELALSALSRRPKISILMPVFNPVPSDLYQAILSVEDQLYPNWELCIADDASTDMRIKDILASAAARDDRIKVVYRDENGHISAATNSAFALATGEYTGFLDHDDILREHALAEIVIALDEKPETEILYSDEDKITRIGKRFEPLFKPDFSPDLFLAMNYLNHFTVHRSDNIRRVGGWRKGFDGAQDYDLNLRIVETIDRRKIVHIPKVLYHWRAAHQSGASGLQAKGYAHIAARKSLEEYVGRAGLSATVEPVEGLPYFRIKRDIPQPGPLVSLIIPTRDMLPVLRSCIASILEKTTYTNYEILIVDNDSREPETLDYFVRVTADPRIRVLKFPGVFNYSAINNFAVGEARGTVLGLINNDTEVISPDWLSEMVSQVVRPEIGCVGAKLLYPDETIQHAGVVLNSTGAAHVHARVPRASAGYSGRLAVCQNYSAVTAACLLVRTAIFHEVGGLDAENLAVAFNDVDFCLKVREAGYLNLFTPFALLYHHESLSRGSDESPEKRARSLKEIAAMQARWGAKLRKDPFYSPNFATDSHNFSIRTF
ncbi:MAG TPA: glycosyltransferase family 2 protein [Parvibaculum sp.]